MLPMLEQLGSLLARVGGELPVVGLDQAVSALLESDRELMRELDRVAANVDAIRTSHARQALKYLDQALEADRPTASKRDRVTKALDALERAEANSPREALSRSIALVYQAVCWYSLGSIGDVRRRLQESVCQAYEALYELAISFNRPTMQLDGGARFSRILPGMSTAAQVAQGRPFPRNWIPGLLTPADRLRLKMLPQIDSNNAWTVGVEQLGLKCGQHGPSSSRAKCHIALGLERQATVQVELTAGYSTTVRGIRVESSRR